MAMYQSTKQLKRTHCRMRFRPAGMGLFTRASGNPVQVRRLTDDGDLVEFYKVNLRVLLVLLVLRLLQAFQELKLRVESTGNVTIKGSTFAYSAGSNTGHVVGQEAFKVGNGAGNSRFAVYADGSIVSGGSGTYSNNSVLIDGPTGAGTFAGNLTVEKASGNSDFILKVGSHTLKIGKNSTANYFDDTAGNPYVWYHNGTERMRINYQGRLGVSHSTPATTLDVQDSIRVRTNSSNSKWNSKLLVRGFSILINQVTRVLH